MNKDFREEVIQRLPLLGLISVYTPLCWVVEVILQTCSVLRLSDPKRLHHVAFTPSGCRLALTNGVPAEAEGRVRVRSVVFILLVPSLQTSI